MTMNQINFYSENKTSVDNELLSKSEKKFAGQSSRSLNLSCLHYEEASSK